MSNEPIMYLNELMDTWSKRADAKPVFGFKMMLHHDPRVVDYLVGKPGMDGHPAAPRQLAGAMVVAADGRLVMTA